MGRLAHSAERLPQASELALATVRSSAAPGSEQESERQDEGAGEVVDVMVIDENDGGYLLSTAERYHSEFAPCFGSGLSITPCVPGQLY